MKKYLYIGFFPGYSVDVYCNNFQEALILISSIQINGGRSWKELDSITDVENSISKSKEECIKLLGI